MDELRSLLSRCVKCGRCRSICPVFQQVNRETAVARGKMALLEAASQNAGHLDPRFAKALSMCLLCGTCTATCPNEAHAHEAIRRARSMLVRDHGLSIPKRALSLLMAKDRASRDRLLKGASALQGMFTASLPEDRGIRFRLPLNRFQRGWIPKLESPFFLQRIPREIPAREPKGKVGLFVGCAIHYLAPQIGDATVGLLNALGFTVVVPEDQGCCGLMAHGMGDEETDRKLALRTMEAFNAEKLDAIVAPCASCAAHLKEGYPIVFKEQGETERDAARKFTEKVWELSAFLVKGDLPRILETKDQAGVPTAVTYHDPCHLSRGLNIRTEPRALLRSLRSVEFREMDEPDRCCGMGGSFRLTHPGISRRIRNEKVKSIENCGAQTVVTGCMGCWIQLKEGVHDCEPRVDVLHLAEILWRDLGN